MDTIYIDRLFVLNLIIDYFLVLGTANICGIKIRRGRYAVSAIVGALYAVCTVLPDAGFLSTAPVKLICGVLMSLTAFGKEERLLRCTVVFFAVSALFGGAVWAISMRSGVSSSPVYIPLSMPTLILSFGVIYGILSIVFRATAKNVGKEIADAEIIHEGASVSLRALRDTGNTLIDPVTGDSVLIASASALGKLIPGCEKLSPEWLSEFPEYKFRLIPYHAVGTSGGLLPAFRPEKIIIDGHIRDDVIVAISAQVSGDNFNAIF